MRRWTVGSLSQLTIPAGSSYSADAAGEVSMAFVATPTSVGTYRVAAQISAQPAGVSDIQVVTDTVSLAFPNTLLRLANGMQSNAVVVQRMVEGNGFFGVDPVTVTLTVSEPGKVGVPATVVIPAYADQVVVPLVGLDLTSSPVTISAQAVGYAAPLENLNVIVETATMDLYLNTQQVPGGPRNAFTVSWAYNPKGDQQVSPVDRPATLTLIEQNPVGIVDGFYAHETGAELIGPLSLRADDFQLTNAQGEQAVIYIGSPTAPGSYRVGVSVPGFGEWTSEEVLVAADDPASLSFSQGSHVVGRGLRAMQVSGRSLEVQPWPAVDCGSGDCRPRYCSRPRAGRHSRR